MYLYVAFLITGRIFVCAKGVKPFIKLLSRNFHVPTGIFMIYLW